MLTRSLTSPMSVCFRPKITKLDFKSSTLIIGVVDDDAQVSAFALS